MSPEKNDRDTPAATLSCGIGSRAKPNRVVSIRHPLPRSCSTGTPRRRPSSASSSVVGACVNPITLKLLACADRIAPVLSVIASSKSRT